MIYHIIRSWNDKNKDIYKKINEIMYCILTLAFGVYYPFFIIHFGNNHPGVLFSTAIADFTLLGNVFIVGIIFIILLWALSAKIRTLRNPELLKTENNYEIFKERFLEEYSKRNKLKRKCFHTIPFGVVGSVIIIYFFFSPLLGNRWFDYARFTIVILGVDFAFTFIIGDLVRLLDFSYMPPIPAKLFRKAMVDIELDTFTSTSVIVFGFGPFLFFDFPIFLIVLLIAAVADACASVSGLLAKKRHYFPPKTDKTIEGYLGGIVFTFLCTVLGVSFTSLFGLSNWSIELTLFIAIILSITFFFIDLFTSKFKIQDNYLNPLISGGILLLILYLLNIPLF
ncbi:MAG: hypothetical protein EU543_02825 [Promethearchaeota archaeon]|nr:MAG: hypothetical protein EU543_02825 [Candidatus Lokiarchaeota archaeon]